MFSKPVISVIVLFVFMSWKYFNWACCLPSYTVQFAAFFANWYSSLLSPSFLCFHFFGFSLTTSLTTLFHHQVLLLCTHPPFVLLQTLSTPLTRQSFRLFHTSSTQLGLTSLMKLWYSACTSGLCTLHNFRFMVIKRGLSEGVWILSTPTSSSCCGMHSLFLMTLTFLTCFSSVLLTRM